jgi:drug/metabolite transporter (DMT)-like permease
LPGALEYSSVFAHATPLPASRVLTSPPDAPIAPAPAPTRPGTLSGWVLFWYLVLCVVWGSTYLAIKIGVRDLTPALFGAVRFLVAGTILLVAALVLGRGLPRRTADWTTNAVVGLLLLVGGNGLVMWAVQFVNSGVAAIFIVTVTLWLALFDSIIPGSEAKPTVSQVGGLLVGLAGTMLLVGADIEALLAADWRGPIALTMAAMCWAVGSVYFKRRPGEASPYVSSAIQMLAGGIAFLLIGTALGEWREIRFTTTAVGAIAYLIVFGSLIGYSAFVYVLRHVPPTLAGTYVYVNTVVAVLLGWFVLSEPITARTVVSMGLVLGAVVWVKRAQRR